MCVVCCCDRRRVITQRLRNPRAVQIAGTKSHLNCATATTPLVLALGLPDGKQTAKNRHHTHRSSTFLAPKRSPRVFYALRAYDAMQIRCTRALVDYATRAQISRRLTVAVMPVMKRLYAYARVCVCVYVYFYFGAKNARRLPKKVGSSICAYYVKGLLGAKNAPCAHQARRCARPTINNTRHRLRKTIIT